ncbi:MAG: choice-of-anchor B family protein [Flavobacteriales bacterium]|nr:choice-of-anchor B family protein [Flavobacteriales bacterium]
MRKFFAAACLLAVQVTFAQTNISFVGQLSYQQLRNSNLSNLWGYTDEDGNEYAIVGVNGTNAQNPGGVSVVSLADPANPQEIFFRPGPASIWREVKVWNDHAYITTEAENGGLVIVDLSPLPQSTALNSVVWFDPTWTTSHSLFIDENGLLYIHGSGRGNGGVIMYDLSDPMNPVEVGEFDQWYCHDSFARGDTLYAAHIYDGFFSIVDVSNPAAPVLLGTQTTPNLFTHNVWLDDSGNNLYTTDERTNSYVGSYNISDPTDIQFQDKLQSDNGSGAIPHNTYWLNHFLVTSYYTFGVTIYDALRPHNLVEVGHYDTSPFTGDGFNGAWGVYPFFDSQNLIISDIEQGLIVLAPTYVRACWLEGNVRNAVNGFPVNNATVSITGVITADPTSISGTYATGYHTPGTYQVVVSAPGFLSATVEGVVLESGEVTFLDIDLVPLVAFTLQGSVVDAASGDPVPNAHVRLTSPTYDYEVLTDAQGIFAVPGVFSDDYNVVAGQWGWRTHCPVQQSIVIGGPSLTIELERGYYDDFEFDFGWAVSGTATVGHWERGVPVGTTFNGVFSNPGADVPGDCGAQAYVTGNGGGAAGNDDLDGGNTVLTSPLFDATTQFDPHIRFRRWFFNAGGSGAPNDRMRISLSNGITTVEVLNITSSSSAWVPVDVRILDHLERTPNMQLIVFITDDEPGHLVEGGLDLFEMVEMSPASVPDQQAEQAFSLWPNPSNGQVEIQMVSPLPATVEVLDALGRMVQEGQRLMNGRATLLLDVPAGTYLVRITSDAGDRSVQRLVIGK